VTVLGEKVTSSAASAYRSRKPPHRLSHITVHWQLTVANRLLHTSYNVMRARKLQEGWLLVSR
jgi:hypothetical protein